MAPREISADQKNTDYERGLSRTCSVTAHPMCTGRRPLGTERDCAGQPMRALRDQARRGLRLPPLCSSSRSPSVTPNGLQGEAQAGECRWTPFASAQHRRIVLSDHIISICYRGATALATGFLALARRLRAINPPTEYGTSRLNRALTPSVLSEQRYSNGWLGPRQAAQQ